MRGVPLVAAVILACGTTGPTRYVVSGSISGLVKAGVTVSLSGTSTASTMSDSSGSYSFSGLAHGSYTLTPSLAGGYFFSPVSISVSVSGASVTGQDFTDTGAYAISGTVSLASGGVLAGVTATLSGAATGTATTNASGNYSLTGLPDGSYTVVPSLAGYTFSPSSLSVTVSGEIAAAQNFTATASGSTSCGSSTALEGTWKANCVQISSDYWIDTWTFTGTCYADTVLAYSDATCATLQFTIDANGSIALPGAASAPPGAPKLDITTTSLKVTPANATAANGYNTIYYCGLSNWSANQANDITGRSCAGSTVFGSSVSSAPLFEDYVLSGTWTLGQCSTSGSTDCRTDADRPTALLPFAYTKQ